MAALSNAYDHSNYVLTRQESNTVTTGAEGVYQGLTFRSRVAAVVTGIGVVLGSASTASLILTLLHNGSVAAVLTLSNSANEVARQFTLSANRTLTAITDRFEIAGPDQTTGEVTVVYEYHIVPGSTYSLSAALG